MRCQKRQQMIRLVFEESKAGAEESIHLPAAVAEQSFAVVVFVWFRPEGFRSDLVLVDHKRIFA
jgi:hypothetical protein